MSFQIDFKAPPLTKDQLTERLIAFCRERDQVFKVATSRVSLFVLMAFMSAGMGVLALVASVHAEQYVHPWLPNTLSIIFGVAAVLLYLMRIDSAKEVMQPFVEACAKAGLSYYDRVMTFDELSSPIDADQFKFLKDATVEHRMADIGIYFESVTRVRELSLWEYSQMKSLIERRRLGYSFTENEIEADLDQHIRVIAPA